MAVLTIKIMKEYNKIFGIGISRTGTKSLAGAIRLLGFSAIHWPKNMGDFWRFHCATDTTVACRFKELDQLFPNSLFIYTEREPESWQESVAVHGFRRPERLKLTPQQKQVALEARIRIYGKIIPRAEDFLPAYRRHHDEVLQYFSTCSEKLLRMNICRGDGWHSLCSFLKIPVPNMPFPHLNKRKQQ